MHSPLLRREELCSISLRAEYQHKLLRIFLHRFFYSPYLFNHLFISVQTHGYLFTLDYNPIPRGFFVFVFVCLFVLFFSQIVPALATGSSQLAPMSPEQTSINVSCFIFEHFLTFWQNKML